MLVIIDPKVEKSGPSKGIKYFFIEGQNSLTKKIILTVKDTFGLFNAMFIHLPQQCRILISKLFSFDICQYF